MGDNGGRGDGWDQVRVVVGISSLFVVEREKEELTVGVKTD
jgi:hypothetical protein